MSDQSQDLKFGATVLENLPELSRGVKQGWIQNPKALQKALRDALCPPGAIPEFKVWRTIRLGDGKTVADFRNDLRRGNLRLGTWASDIIEKPAFTTATEETEVDVDLVRVTVAELGFKKDARRHQIYERAKELGLELCPAEVGPQLRLQYQDQPNREQILIGMEPFIVLDGSPRAFGVERLDSELWLSAYYGSPGRVWDADSQWVFVRRK